MSMTLTMTKAYLEAKNFKHRVVEERNVIETGVGGLKNKGNIEITIFFDDNDRTVAIRTFEYCSFPAEKKAAMYEVCSKLNNEFRWIKFYVDERDNTITLADDAIVQLDTCGEEIWEIMVRLSDIADDAYPTIMKAIWQ